MTFRYTILLLITYFLLIIAIAVPSLWLKSVLQLCCDVLPFLEKKTQEIVRVGGARLRRKPQAVSAHYVIAIRVLDCNLPLKNLMISVKSIELESMMSLYVSNSAKAKKSTKCVDETCCAAQITSHVANTSG